MAKAERLLRVPRDLTLPSECAACGRVFREPDVLKKFDEHNCDDNDNQAAALHRDRGNGGSLRSIH